MIALAGGPVAEFFTVGTYYAVSLTMIQVDLGLALAQMLKDWYSGSRPGISAGDQSRYARMYSSTAVSALLMAALVAIGVIASRFAARFRASLPKGVVDTETKPPVPGEKQTPVLAPSEARRFGLPAEGYLPDRIFMDFLHHEIPSEGWKLHVSADAASAPAVADAVLPRLRGMGVNHKVVGSVEALQSMSSGQQAKFITIYPDSPAQARSIVGAVDAAVSGVPGGSPAVAGELPVGSSGRVFTRYGGFTKSTVTDPATGLEVPDRRGQISPPWVENPWTGQPVPVPPGGGGRQQ